MIIIDHFINYQEKGTSFVTVISGLFGMTMIG